MAKGGDLIIQTAIDNSKFEKQYNKLETKLKNEELKLNIKTGDLENAKKELQQANIELGKIKNQQKDINDLIAIKQKQYDDINAKVITGTPISDEERRRLGFLDDGISKLKFKQEDLNVEFDKYNEKVNKANDLLSKTQVQYDIQKDKVEQLRQEFENLEKSSNSTEGIRINFNKLIKSAKKLTMGIIGVRASYSLIRKMASSYLADNEKTTQRISNLWTGLGVLMGNIIEGIVSLLKKAVTAILYFASVLTNVNYIAKANEAILKKQKKATSDLRKEQNKLNASFDEMEVLQDNSSSTNEMSAVGPVELFDVNELGKAKEVIEELAKKLQPVWEIVKGIVDFSLKHPEVVITILGGMKLVKLLGKIIGVAGHGLKAGTGLAGIMSACTALLAIGTIVIGVKLKNESDEFGNMLEQIRNDGKTIHDEFIKSETDINKIIENSNVKRKSGNDLIKDSQKLLGILTGSTLKETLETIKQISSEVSRNIEKEIELYNQGEKNAETQSKIKDEIYNQYLYNENVIKTLKDRGYSTKEIEELNKKLIKNYQDMGGKIEDANGKIKLLKNNSKITIDIDANTKKAEKKVNSLWDILLEGPKSLLEGIKAMFSTSTKKGIGGRAKGGIYYPKLAVGGIINQPGRGVPYHGATIGESGAEAVVPLTDSQQMQLLGEAIGKYITINANIVNTMNGRIISKELQKVQNETNFAINR